ncbi:MAG: hypothetical protein ACR2H6_01390 [Pyrinomonadaceae bacterium]
MKLQKIGSGILAFSFMLLVGVSSSSVQGQDRWGRNDQDQRERQRQWERDQRRQRGDERRGNRGNGRSDDGYSNYGGSFQLRQTALNAGANEGNKEGRKDRSRGERFDFTDESAFRSATKDYNSRLGDRELYRRYFREAFENGYRDGYAGY